MSDYIPKPEDIQWTETFVKLLSDGCVWGTSFAVYRLFPTQKKIEIVSIINEKERHKVHVPITAVFKEIGWEMKDGSK
jgi:hypothetical protein